MAFKAAFVAHAPDADPEKHKAVIATPKYELFVAVVRGQDQAVEECKRVVEEEGIQAVMLCPGFTNRDVAGIAEAVGENVAVNVARGDGPGTRIAMEIIGREWA